MVDTNGINPPNTYGKDIFGFYIQSNRILPFGAPGDTTYLPTTCNADGHGCAYPYIYGFTASAGATLPSCSSDTTLGLSCVDSNGVNAFYAGTCSETYGTEECDGYGDCHSNSDDVASGNWQQTYYGNASENDPGCNGSNMYFLQQPTTITQSTCLSNGGIWSDYYGCYPTYAFAEKYCASLNAGSPSCGAYNSTNLSVIATTPSTCWRVPSENQLNSICGNASVPLGFMNYGSCPNNSLLGTNAIINPVWSSTQSDGWQYYVEFWDGLMNQSPPEGKMLQVSCVRSSS